MKPHLKRLTALLLLPPLLLLSGCGKVFDTVTLEKEITTVTLPKDLSNLTPAPVGDERATGLFRPFIYYADLSGEIFQPRTRVLSAHAEEDYIKRLAEEVLNTPSSGALAVAPKDTRILATETGNTLSLVRLLPSSSLTQKEVYLLSSALSKTVFENTDVEGVSLMLSDRALTLGNLPLGVITEETDLNAYFSEDKPAPGGTYTRNVSLYYPAADGEHMLAQTASVGINVSDPVSSLLSALCRAPETEAACSLRLNPETAFEKPSEYTINANGDRILNLFLTESALSSLSSGKHTLSQAFAAITLTLTTFLPETDGVSIRFPSGQVTEATLAKGEKARFENGILTRSAFAPLIGECVNVYSPGAGEFLTTETRVLPLTDLLSVRIRLGCVFESSKTRASASFFPEGVTERDILGIRVADGTAHIHLSGDLYRKCQAFSRMEEELFVYSIVNTLTELDAVSGVRFYVEGETVSVLTRYVHIESTLLANPGRVSER